MLSFKGKSIMVSSLKRSYNSFCSSTVVSTLLIQVWLDYRTSMKLRTLRKLIYCLSASTLCPPFMQSTYLMAQFPPWSCCFATLLPRKGSSVFVSEVGNSKRLRSKVVCSLHTPLKPYIKCFSQTTWKWGIMPVTMTLYLTAEVILQLTIFYTTKRTSITAWKKLNK